MTADDLIRFWLKSAEEDLRVARDNLKLKHYHWSLVLTHDLVKLAREAGIKLTLGRKQDFKEITSFNVEARYDDIKLSFYKKATLEYTKKWAKKCEEYYLWLKEI